MAPGPTHRTYIVKARQYRSVTRVIVPNLPSGMQLDGPQDSEGMVCLDDVDLPLDGLAILPDRLEEAQCVGEDLDVVLMTACDQFGGQD